VHRARGRPHGDLGGRHESQAEAIGCRRRVAEAGERVVIGQRERLETERVRVLDERRRREQPVGGRRMAVQVQV
jgi:hypothetical protein